MRSDVDGMVLVYDHRRVTVHELNATMSALVAMADRGLGFEDMVVELSAGYDLSHQDAAEAVLSAFHELAQAGLLIRV